MNPPVIHPCGIRHRISVMIPTYNRLDHLEKTLTSVLKQARAPEEMQIVVVDNDSRSNDPEPLVKSLGQGRVQFHRNERNLGLAGNFNRCIELASGEWVHILHSDDFVYDGFYDSVLNIGSDAAIECIAFRCNQVDQNDAILCETPDLSGSDPNPRARELFLNPMPVQCPGVIVKRAAYERCGGWLPQFQYLLDVEMWSRIFFNVKTHFSSEVMAAFRLHGGSESAAQIKVAGELWELYELLPLVKQNMQLSDKETLRFSSWLHRRANDHCRKMAECGDARTWMKMQKFYFSHLTSPRDYADFVFRFERNLRRRISASFRHGKSVPA